MNFPNCLIRLNPDTFCLVLKQFEILYQLYEISLPEEDMEYILTVNIYNLNKPFLTKNLFILISYVTINR